VCQPGSLMLSFGRSGSSWGQNDIGREFMGGKGNYP
jgi:hypothetical protein